jgi:hypothetical protein
MKLSIKQTEALEVFEDDVHNEIVFGGGAGGGKSILGCYVITKMCLKYPSTRWVIGRAVLKTLKETTLQSLFFVFKSQGLKRDTHYIYNQQNSDITFFNGSVILLKDLFTYPSDPNHDELGSLEITGGFVDECNQITEKCWNILRSRIRHKLDENGLIPKLIGSCNPSKGWVYDGFYKATNEGTIRKDRMFIQALADDNPFISKHYLESLDLLDEKSRRRLRLGDWEYDEDPTVLMRYDKIIDMKTNPKLIGKNYITVDVARKGNDKTVIMVWYGLSVAHCFVEDKSNMDDLKARIKHLQMIYKVPTNQVIVDEDGVGGGLVDALRGCIGFVNNSTALNKENYNNLKSQCYFKLADYVNENKIHWGVDNSEIFSNLVQELEQIKDWNSDKDAKKAVIPKDEIKKILGRSPDYSDALMMRMYFELNKPPRPKMSFIKTNKR